MMALAADMVSAGWLPRLPDTLQTTRIPLCLISAWLSGPSFTRRSLKALSTPRTVRFTDIVPGSQQRGARGIEHGVVGAAARTIGIAMFQQDAGGCSRLRGLSHQAIHAHKRSPSRAMLRNRVGFVWISGCSHSSIQIGSGVMLTPVSSSTS